MTLLKLISPVSFDCFICVGASRIAQSVKNLPAKQETTGSTGDMGLEVPLEEEMATHSIQYACLRNPMDRGAWWAKVHGVAKHRT